MEKTIKEIEENLKKQEYNPSIKKDVEEFLLSSLKQNKPKQILEIGTNMGRSSLLFLKASPFSLITTIEKDEQIFLSAKQNFEKAKVSKSITQILGDAKQVLADLAKQKPEFYDFVFLDGPKGQYINYLPNIKKLLAKGGVLVADNIYFKGEVLKQEFPKRKHRTIILNLKKFISSLETDSDFETKFLDLGDGVSVSVKLL